MEEKLALALENLGMEGIQAFYVYLAFDYGSLWILLGLMTWGVRVVWKHHKGNA